MVKIIGKMEKIPNEKPEISQGERFVIVSKNRKNCLDIKEHWDIGKLTKTEAEKHAKTLNQKKALGRFWWIKKITNQMVIKQRLTSIVESRV